MKIRLQLMRTLLVLAGLLLAATPTAALAHDNIGGDELAAASWMLLGALLVAVMGILAGLWAWRVGQFSNIEESKYRMLETAEDFDAIMAEADARDNASHVTANAASNRQVVPRPVSRVNS